MEADDLSLGVLGTDQRSMIFIGIEYNVSYVLLYFYAIPFWTQEDKKNEEDG